MVRLLGYEEGTPGPKCRTHGFVTCSKTKFMCTDISYPDPKDRDCLWCTAAPSPTKPAPGAPTRLDETGAVSVSPGQRRTAACGETPASQTTAL